MATQWTRSTLGQHADLVTGYAFDSGSYSANGDGIRLLRGDNVMPQRVRWDNAKKWDEDAGQALSRYALRAGDTVVAMDRTWIAAGAKVAQVQATDLPSLLVQRVARLRAREALDQNYMYQLLSGRGFESYVRSAKTETVVPHISPHQIRAFSIPLPPLPEQRRIAEILRTWDEAIERSETLVLAETTAFDALRRRLFASGDQGVPLSEVSTRITTKSDGSPHTVMAISAKKGFVAQSDKYRRDMAGASLANYTLLRRGEFAYNKGNSLTYPQGCIYALKTDSALVPNVYYSFRLRGDLNSSYYEHFFASGALNRQLAQRITSGVRGNGLLNLNAKDFFGVKVPVPSRATQDGAADAMNMGARKIELMQTKADLLRTQKCGLMQKLLTGHLRVNVAAEIEPGRADDD